MFNLLSTKVEKITHTTYKHVTGADPEKRQRRAPSPAPIRQRALEAREKAPAKTIGKRDESVAA